MKNNFKFVCSLVKNPTSFPRVPRERGPWERGCQEPPNVCALAVHMKTMPKMSRQTEFRADKHDVETENFFRLNGCST